jgi:hypothetical protein
MEKAFDFKALEERLKAKGLTAIEGLAEIIVGETFDWAAESCAIHPNALVKAIGVPAIAMVKPLAMGAVDKIDGIPG